MYKRLTSGLRLVTLLLLAAMTAACSHDRYLFLERAQLDNLNQQLSQQQSRLETLTAVNQQQFDSLSRSQQFQRQELLNVLRDQNAKLDKLYIPPPRPLQVASTNTGPDAPGRYQGKLVVGEVERLYMAVPGIIYEARIDSGATTSSLHATNIRRFERDGEDWVRFDMLSPESDKPVTVERKLVRNANIIQASSEDPERRPVVELPFVIGSHRQSAEFTLSDRSQLTYPVLIGRNVLRDVMLIDVGREHVTELPDTLTRPADTGDES